MSVEKNAPALSSATCRALVEYLLAWADDELLLGHRDSEWTGFAPQIEEDVAFSSIAQDELGHAAVLYDLIAQLDGDDRDRLALRRPAAEYRHAALVEQPNGDWADTIARHYLYDLADSYRIDTLADSSYAPLATLARKMQREEHYHLLHDEAWWVRLRDGSPESRARLIAATRRLVPLAIDLFGETAGEHDLVAAGIVPCPAGGLLDEWRLRVTLLLAELDAGLSALLQAEPRPRVDRPVSEEFRALHAEMTLVSAAGLGERW